MELTRRGMERVLLACALVAPLGCQDHAPDLEVDGTTGEPDASDPDAGTDTDASALPDAESCSPPTVTPLLRRLTVAEYRASVRDLLGIETEDLASRFPDDATVHGFSNNASVQTVLLGHTRAYQDVAEVVTQRVLDNPARREAVVGCVPGTEPSDPCLMQWVDTFTNMAYRRPSSPEERSRLLALAETSGDSDPWHRVGLVLRAILQSPHFLYRVERGVPDADDPSIARLDGFEIATRLSYFLWQTTPDAWLIEMAAQGGLDDADGVADTAREMLDDPRARASIEAFVAGWLRLAALEDLGRDPEAYPQWGPSLRASMRAELLAKTTDTMLSGRSLLELFDGRRTFVDGELAPLYDLEMPPDGALHEVELPAGGDRAGILGTAAVLALTTPTNVTSPVRRGMFVWESMLCSPLPPPPPGVVAELPELEDLSKTEVLELHRTDPSCAGCHELLDPIGLGLERYDALGQLRSVDEGGEPVSERGELPLPGGGEFGGAAELGQTLAGLPEVHRCLSIQVLRWAMGRVETPEDECLLDAMQEAVGQGDYALLVETIVRSRVFRTRPAP